MGFSLKKAVKSVAKVASAPLQVANSATKTALNATGGTKLAGALGIDTNNLLSQSSAVMGGKIQTGSNEFKTAAFDAAKIGAIGAGVGGAVAGSTAGATFMATTKAQMGGGVSIGDIASVAGFDPSLGGVNLGNVNVVKPKKQQSLFEALDFNQGYEDAYSTVTAPKNRQTLYIAIGVISLIGIVLIARKIKK
jgi:hypothetical protein